jgi:hypothetical protein
MSKEREEALEHFGVKGMRWGVRKPRPDSSQIAAARIESARLHNRVTELERAKKDPNVRFDDLDKLEKYLSGLRSDPIHKIAAMKTNGERFARAAVITSLASVGIRTLVMASFIGEDSGFRSDTPQIQPQPREPNARI